VECNIAKLIVMTGYFHLLETCIVLRMMIFGAGVLAGAGTPIQDETCAAGGYDVCACGDEGP